MITTIIVTMIMTIVAISKNFHRNQHIPGVPTLWTSACRPASLLLHLPHHCPHRGWVCLVIVTSNQLIQPHNRTPIVEGGYRLNILFNASSGICPRKLKAEQTFAKKRWNILSGIVELLLLRLIHSSCEDLQKAKVLLEGKQEEKQGVATAFSSTWQVSKARDGHGVLYF